MSRKAARKAAISKRRAAREIAFIRCYSKSLGGDIEYSQFLETDPVNLGLEAKEIDLGFTDLLTNGVYNKIEELDKRIDEASTSWKIDRIAHIDLSIIRVALFEMMFCDDIPVEVSINEAVELSKKYGGEKSAQYVNGILGALSRSAIEPKPVDV